MSAMLAKTKAAASAAADATARTAKATKLKGDIMMAQNKIAGIKKELGVPIYDALLANNEIEVQRLFNEAKEKIDALEAGVAEKKATVETLKTPRAASDDAAAPGAPPTAPPPPPGAEQPLPEGWRKTTTAEGREYYYHEGTGETSWTVPTA